MNNWFECKIKYEKLDDKGKGKKVTETYLVDALTFSEAEERISKQVAPFMTGDFSISGMKKAGINEIFPNEEGDRWYKCKVSFISIDEVKATEKRITSYILVLGSNIKEAWDHLADAMKDTMADYEVSSITETQIMDIFPYSIDEEPTKKSEEQLLAEELSKDTAEEA
ncbi:MAG: DUF4494 domain-containing protein [Paludibacteraceae bacterium]|nr:DUF4494 domain-containing protein [Prevotellaceae bacterium]